MPWQANNAAVGRKQRLAGAGNDASASASLHEVGRTALRVVDAGAEARCAFVSKGTLSRWKVADEEPLVFARTHPQFLIPARSRSDVPDGCIALSESQRLNFEVVENMEFEWTAWTRVSKALSELAVEVRPRHLNPGEPFAADARRIVGAISKLLFTGCVTLHEIFVFECAGVEFVGRVLEAIEEDDEDDGESLSLADDFRGRVEASTSIHVSKDTSRGEWTLKNSVRRADKPARANVIDVYCSDGEWFPVKKKLLQPCIALTKYVLGDASERPRVDLDIDCCLFDRVLIYLESEAGGKEAAVEPEHATDLLKCAEKLKLRGLEDLCLSVLGEFESRVRKEGLRWSEVIRRNAQGETLLVIDGMVFDVTRWLPEHPGGKTIIPNQALNKDSTVFFELFHSSRQSFVYLKQFYIGDLVKDDLSKVPPASKGDPSDAFIEVLRRWCTWRQTPMDKVHKSF